MDIEFMDGSRRTSGSGVSTPEELRVHDVEIDTFSERESVMDKVKRYGGAVLAMAKVAVTNQID